MIEGFKEGVEKELMREYAAGISHYSSVVEHGKERALLDIVYLFLCFRELGLFIYNAYIYF